MRDDETVQLHSSGHDVDSYEASLEVHSWWNRLSPVVPSISQQIDLSPKAFQQLHVSRVSQQSVFFSLLLLLSVSRFACPNTPKNMWTNVVQNEKYRYRKKKRRKMLWEVNEQEEQILIPLNPNLLPKDKERTHVFHIHKIKKNQR